AGGANGLTVDAGSVIRAVGTVPAGTDRSITIGSTSSAAPVSGDGALLRVSNGDTISITRVNLPSLPPRALTIRTPPAPPRTAPGTADVAAGAAVAIDGGKALTIDTSGNNVFAPDVLNPDGSVMTRGVTLTAQNYDLSASVINIGGGSAGLVLGQSLIDNFA